MSMQLNKPHQDSLKRNRQLDSLFPAAYPNHQFRPWQEHGFELVVASTPGPHPRSIKDISLRPTLTTCSDQPCDLFELPLRMKELISEPPAQAVSDARQAPSMANVMI